MTISRPYASEDDYGRLRRFLVAQPGIREFGAVCTVGDLDWWRFAHENREQMQQVPLWLDEQTDEVVAFAWPDGSTVELIVDPRRQELLPEMIRWAEELARREASETVTIVANDDDTGRQAFLTEAGFAATDRHYTYRRQRLDRALPAPLLPEGFHIEDMRDASDDAIERRVNVHRAAWAPSKMTVAKHRAVMGSQTYRPDLDLVVIAPDGTYATCTIVWHDPDNRIGVFEPVGCDPEFRQRGLTRALMEEGMRRLTDLGAGMAFVNTWHASLPANRLYERCRFEVVVRQHIWEKRLG